MLTATKEFKWEMAHMLTGHKGACANLHGHSYKMQVTVACEGIFVNPTGSSEGMVMDFGDLKAVVNKLVDALDHSYMYDARKTAIHTLAYKVGELLENSGTKTYKTTYRPTAENMAYDFFYQIEDMLKKSDADNIKLVKVAIWETETAYAEFSRK